MVVVSTAKSGVVGGPEVTGIAPFASLEAGDPSFTLLNRASQ